MTMQSLSLLPDLRKLPAAEGADTLGPDETVARIRGMDRNHFAIEVSLATEEALEALFHARNVPDKDVLILNEAFGKSFSSIAEDSLPARALPGNAGAWFRLGYGLHVEPQGQSR